MYKKEIYILMYLSILLPLLLLAAPLNKYYLPQQTQVQQTQVQQMPASAPVPATKQNSDIYNEFKNKVKNISKRDKLILINKFNERLSDAWEGKDYDEAAYYQRLIDILNSSLKES